jgi:hypothetical protein
MAGFLFLKNASLKITLATGFSNLCYYFFR